MLFKLTNAFCLKSDDMTATSKRMLFKISEGTLVEWSGRRLLIKKNLPDRSIQIGFQYDDALEFCECVKQIEKHLKANKEDFKEKKVKTFLRRLK
jgi:hypothetical protein